MDQSTIVEAYNKNKEFFNKTDKLMIAVEAIEDTIKWIKSQPKKEVSQYKELFEKADLEEEYIHFKEAALFFDTDKLNDQMTTLMQKVIDRQYRGMK